jgi:hypothetical protein
MGKIKFIVVVLAAIFLIGCQNDADLLQKSADSNSIESELMKDGKGFVHGIKADIDGVAYYFEGPADGPNGSKDIPGHYWVQAGPNQFVGKHYNTGPFGASKWWSSDAKDGAYLYTVHGIVDTWTLAKAQKYYNKGYVHYHELARVSDGTFHPMKIVWLKHVAVTRFTLDGGPGAPNPPYAHYVTPGVDLEFPNNGFIPYP